MKALGLAIFGGALVLAAAGCDSILGIDRNYNELDCPFPDSCSDATTGAEGGDDATTTTEGGGDSPAAADAGDAAAQMGDGPSTTTGDGDAGPTEDTGAPEDTGSPQEAGCAAGQLACDGGCLPNDPRNCGACGHDCTTLPNVSGQVACGAGGTCQFDAGACASGYAHRSNGSPDHGCETQITTTSNCGACGTACGASTPYCSGTGSSYMCSSGCTGQTPTLCNKTCVDTTTDPNNCKTCGNVCTTQVQHATPTCNSSMCSYACNGGYSPCASAGGCADFSNDNGNCGSCGHGCASGETCVMGMCQCTSPNHVCGGACVANDANACGSSCVACAAPSGGGSVSCDGTKCVPACPGGLTYCPTTNSCVNTATDNGNCGSCGMSCTLPNTCGGAGTPGVCGCAAKTCVGLGKNCGMVPDGCGNMLNCGSTCPSLSWCNANVCTTSCTANAQCGSGGCCPAQMCVADTAVNACGPTCIDCATSNAGRQCMAGKCGCATATDCIGSTYGTACLGSGTCGCMQATDCPPQFACHGGVCETSCNGSGGPYCNGGCCMNGTCAKGNDPQTGCGSNGATCMACPFGTAPQCFSFGNCGCGVGGACPANDICNSTGNGGKCQLAPGQPCSATSGPCASGQCASSTCTTMAHGAPCRFDADCTSNSCNLGLCN